MKYLDFKSFAHFAELCQRQNGKTTEAVKATLNRLMDISGPSRILFVGQNHEFLFPPYIFYLHFLQDHLHHIFYYQLL